MEKIRFLAACDSGNSELDAFLGDTSINSPNVHARIARLPSMDEVNPEYVLHHIHDHLITSVDGALYYVGSYAIRSGERCRSIEVGVDNNKATSPIVFVGILSHIAGEAAKRALESEKDYGDVIHCEADMATALPVSYYTRSLATAFAQKFMGKKHLVTVYAGPKEIPVMISFPFVRVIPEGVTASHAFLADPKVLSSFNQEEPPLTLEELKVARILHIAIGEGTTEFPVTKGILFEPSFIQGTNNGTGHAIDRVIEEFKKVYGLLKLTRQGFSIILKDPGHKYHATAMEYIMPALEDEAEEILHMAESVIQKADNEVDIVAVYGGGSILMREALEARLAAFLQRARIRLYYAPPEEAVIVEALGLKEFVRSKLFRDLKKRTLSIAS